MTGELEVLVFDKPSGNVAGVLIALLPDNKGKPRRLAHAYILVDDLPKVTVTPPASLSMATLAQVNDLLRRFETQLHELVAAHGPREVLPAPSAVADEQVRVAATALVRHHLDSVAVHPCDAHNDDIRAGQCIPEVQDLHAALRR